MLGCLWLRVERLLGDFKVAASRSVGVFERRAGELYVWQVVMISGQVLAWQVVAGGIGACCHMADLQPAVKCTVHGRVIV